MNYEYDLYHKDIFFPQQFKLSHLNVFVSNNIRLSKHLMHHIKYNDYKHKLSEEIIFNAYNDICNSINILCPFEIGYDKKTKKLVKAVYRVSMNSHQDISMVLCKKANEIIIVTAWLNHKNDTHKTLNEKLYIR